MTVTTLSPTPVFKAWANDGTPLAYGTLTTYQAGSVTPIATYVDSTGTTTNTNPIILNARGECNLWLTPNVSYKLALADRYGNAIWTIDQIDNSQLLSLYGGVDSGIANAYVLTFAASFNAYADGIVIYWIPSHTNTGASTINVNGLGVVPIVNQDGSALGASSLVANQVSEIMYKGGNFLLLSTGNVAQTGTFIGTLTGMTLATTGTITYTIVGGFCNLRGVFTGTSNSTSMDLTGVIAKCRSSLGGQYLSCMLEDNGAIAGGWAQTTASDTIHFGIGINANQTGFTSTGTKGLPAGWSITYSLT